jgi:ribosomal protein L7/L12
VGKDEKSNLKEILEVIRKAVKELKGKEINALDALKLTKEGEKIILEGVAKDKAEEVKKQLEEKGAKVEIK